VSERTDREIVQRLSRELASKLKRSFQWVDNYSKPEGVNMVPTPYGMFTYTGYMIVRPHARLRDGAAITKPKPSHKTITGILAPNAPARVLSLFRQVMEATARRLGAPPDQVEVTRDDTQKASRIISPSEKTKKPECVSLSWPADGAG